jgi:hypothetical protein
MALSGTYAYNPSLGELMLYAFNLCQIRSTALTQEHMESARMAANLLQARWSAQGVNLWAVDLQTVALVQGQNTYSVPNNTVAMLDAYITTGTGATAINRYILPVSRSEYASYPTPLSQGFPSVYWFDRLLAPTVTLYQTPDGTQTSLSYYRVRQIQDANLANGAQIEVPFYFLDAFATGLAHRLALIWKPEMAAMLKDDAKEAYDIAANQNVETANIYISPIVSGYWKP